MSIPGSHSKSSGMRAWRSRLVSRTSNPNTWTDWPRSRRQSPAVNQVELHPYFQQGVLRDRHAEAGILTESWGPLGQGKYSLADIPEIQQIADDTGATVAQVVLRWHIQEGLVVIPKSVSTDRLRENLAAGELELSADQMELMRGLERGQRLGPDPSEATF